MESVNGQRCTYARAQGQSVGADAAVGHDNVLLSSLQVHNIVQEQMSSHNTAYEVNGHLAIKGGDGSSNNEPKFELLKNRRFNTTNYLCGQDASSTDTRDMGHKLTISNVAAAISGNTKLALAQLSRARNKRRVDATRSTDPRLRTLQFQEYQENWATRAFESMRLHPATRTLPQPLALSDDDLGEASPGPRAVPRPPTPPRPSQKRLDIEKSHWYEDGHNLDENADDAATNDKTQNEAAAASSPMGPGELSEGEDPTVDDRTRKEDSSGSSQICTQEELANLTRMVFGDEDEELDESFWDDADGAPRAAITHPGSHERAGVMDQQHKEGNTGGTSEEASKLDRLFGPTPNTCLLTSSPRSHQDEDEDRNAAVVQDILEVAAGSATIDTSDSARSTENDTSPGAITSTLATSPEPSYPALNHPSPTQHSPPPESEDEAPTGNLYPRDSLEADAGIWEVLSAHNGISRTIEASTTKYRTRITSPEVQPALVAPTPGAPRPPVFASGDEATGIITPGQLALALNDRLERGDQEDVKPLLAGSGTNHAANASEQGVYDSECDGNVLHTNAVGVVGLDASRPVVEREMAGDSDEVVGLLLDAPKDWYPKDQYDQDMDAAQVDMQVDFPTPMDEGEDEDELELSHTTFDPLLTYQPHPYSHSPGIQQDDLIVEDNGAAFAADSAMEDRAAESWQTTASMRETETLLPFSWVPPSLSSALHAIFPSVPSAQTASFVNCSMPVVGPPMLPDPCAVVTMVSEGVRLQQFAPPQDIVLPFVSDSPCPSPSMQGVELLKEPASFVPKLSPTSVSTRDTTKRSSFPPLSRPMMKADPVSVSPFIWMPTQKRREEGKDLDEEVGPKPAVVTIVQPEASPLRSLNIHKSVGLDASPSQPPPANSDASLPLPCYPCAVGTMEINHFPPASASPIHPNEDGTKDEGNKVKTGDGLLETSHEIGDHPVALVQPVDRISPPPTDLVTVIKLPPPVPPRVAGAKRKFVEDKSRYRNSINPARKIIKLPRSKKQKFEHGNYSTLKRLEEVKAMHRITRSDQTRHPSYDARLVLVDVSWGPARWRSAKP